MFTRLSGWQRIGIVLTVIWILVGGFWGNNIGIHEGDWAGNSLSICYETHPDDWTGCRSKFDRDFIQAVKYHWYDAAIFAFVPIPIGRLGVYGLIALTQWVRRGFKSST
jgi:hypothetical protein